MYFFLTFAYWYIPLQTRGKYQKKRDIPLSLECEKKEYAKQLIKSHKPKGMCSSA